MRLKFPETIRPEKFRDLDAKLWDDWNWQKDEASRANGLPPYWPGGDRLAEYRTLTSPASTRSKSSLWRNDNDIQDSLARGDFSIDGDKDIAFIELSGAEAFLPQRITDSFVEVFKKADQVFVETQFNHPAECTREAFDACAKLADAGFILNNRMTLLKGVNDNPEMVKLLNHRLLMMRIRPYCIQKLDFSTDPKLLIFDCEEKTGVEILETLRGWTSGLAVPHYVIRKDRDYLAVPNYIKSFENGTYVFRNYRNNEYAYRDS